MLMRCFLFFVFFLVLGGGAKRLSKAGSKVKGRGNAGSSLRLQCLEHFMPKRARCIKVIGASKDDRNRDRDRDRDRLGYQSESVRSTLIQDVAL